MNDEDKRAEAIVDRAAKEALAVVAKAAEAATLVLSNAASNAINALTTATAVQSNDINSLKDSLRSISSKIDSLEGKFVTHEAFGPVRNVVYGLVGTIGFAMIAAIIKLVLPK